MVYGIGNAVIRSLDEQLLRRLQPRLRRQWLYLRAHRRWPDLTNPSTFSEKVNWRIVHDRRPLLEWTCDKLQMKERAAATCPDLVVPRTLWTGVDVAELADVDLPEGWVLKPAHRSGLVRFGDGRIDLRELAAATSGWLDGVEDDVLGEWAYGRARRRLLVEELIGPPGSPPPDYKFFVFDGEVHLVQVDLARFTRHTRSLFTPEWEKLDLTLAYPDGGAVPRPALLERMLHVARRLGAGFDFVRVDLYTDGDQVVFGEFTPYPGSGLEPFTPRSSDGWLGARWRLPSLAQVTPPGSPVPRR